MPAAELLSSGSRPIGVFATPIDHKKGIST